MLQQKAVTLLVALCGFSLIMYGMQAMFVSCNVPHERESKIGGRMFPPQNTPVETFRWYSPYAEDLGKRGRISVFVVGSAEHLNEWRDSIKIWECYCNMYDYALIVKTIPSDDSWYPNIYFEKVRLARRYLPEYEYMLVIDADMLPVNFSVLIEHIVDPRFDLLLIDREEKGNGEVYAGTYLVHNSSWSLSFMDLWLTFRKWAVDGKLLGADNSALHAALLLELYPLSRYHVRAYGNETASETVASNEYENADFPCAANFSHATTWLEVFDALLCFRTTVGIRHVWASKVKLMLPWMGWMRMWDEPIEDPNERDNPLFGNSSLAADFLYHVRPASRPYLLQLMPPEILRGDEVAARSLVMEQKLSNPVDKLPVLSTDAARWHMHSFIKRKGFRVDGHWRYYHHVAACWPRCSESPE